MRFAEPQMLWLLLLVPLFGMLALLAWHRRRKAAERFASADMLARIAAPVSTVRRWFKLVLQLGALTLLMFALARPQWGRTLELVQRRGLDIVLLQDVSLSMLADDIKPDRMTRARHEVSDFISKLSGDRIGLVAFEGEAHTLCPLTLDYAAARIFLDDLRPGWLYPGTDIAAAMKKGMRLLRGSDTSAVRSLAKYRVMVLVTDGEEHKPEALEVAKQAAEEGITIYTVGVGSRDGVPIPLQRTDGRTEYKKDRHGNLVTTRLDESTLQQIAFTTGGKYYWAGPGDFQLAKILEDLKTRERKELQGGQVESFQDRYQGFLLLAIFLFVLEALVSLRGKRKLSGSAGLPVSASAMDTASGLPKSSPERTPLAGLLLSAVVMMLALGLAPASASIAKGNELFAKKDYEGALREYLQARVDDPESRLAQYNIGTALQAMGRLDESAKELQEVFLQADSALSRHAGYNLANTLYRKGMAEQGPQGRVQAWREAVAVLKKVLDQSPGYDKAKRNLEFLQAKLKEELDKQKEQQKQNQDPKNDKQKQPELSAEAKAALARALSLVRQGKYAEAKRVLEDIMAKDAAAQQKFAQHAQRIQDLVDIFAGQDPGPLPQNGGGGPGAADPSLEVI